MTESVVVTGVGPVSAIGIGRDDFWNALVEGRHGFGPVTLCELGDIPSKVAAEVKEFDLGDYVEKGTLMARWTPRPVQFALAAGVLALHDAQIDLDSCNPDRFGVHVGTSVGNFETIFATHKKFEAGTLPPHAAFHCFNHSGACVVSSFFNIRGPMYTTSQGCNSGLDALGQSVRMIQSGAVDAMLVIGTDCEVVPEIMSALAASNSLSTRYNDDPGRASRPFDAQRDGNVIGEGAAALLLESEGHAARRLARVYARVAGYAIASAGQNRQYSHDDPEVDTRPCVRAFQGALKEAGWHPSDVDLVSANGSSSVLYDRIEAQALGEVFGDALPQVRVHSTKSMLGQHGAGSSALQAVAACLSIRRGVAPPTINHEELDPSCGPLRIVTEAEACEPKRVLTHAIGLGGFYYSCAAFASPPPFDAAATGMASLKWSEGGHRRYKPTQRYSGKLKPWRPVSEKD